MVSMDAAGSAGGNNAGNAATDNGYDDMHRLVLQGMMASGILDAKGVKKLFIAACSYLQLDPEERTPMPYVQKVMRDINDKIKPFDMAIKSASCELTGKKFYMFLLTVEKPLMKLQSVFTAFEVELLQKVIDTIFRKYSSFTVPFTECINLATQVEAKGNINQAETFLKKVLEMNYLTTYPLEGGDFHITVGIRGLRELEPLLRDCYGEFLANCSLCKTTLLHGLLCSECHIAIHKHCYKRYLTDLKSVSAAAVCPNHNCKVSWDDKSQMIVRVRDVESFDYETNETEAGDQSPPNLDVDIGQSPVPEGDEDDSNSMPTLGRAKIQPSKKYRNRRRHNVETSEESD